MARYLGQSASSKQAMAGLRTALDPAQQLPLTDLPTSGHANDDAYGQDEDVDMLDKYERSLE